MDVTVDCSWRKLPGTREDVKSTNKFELAQHFVNKALPILQSWKPCCFAYHQIFNAYLHAQSLGACKLEQITIVELSDKNVLFL